MKNYSRKTNKKVIRYRTPSPFRAMSGESAKRTKAFWKTKECQVKNPFEPKIG